MRRIIRYYKAEVKRRDTWQKKGRLRRRLNPGGVENNNMSNRG